MSVDGADWSAAYLVARAREGRHYSDAEVARLPDVAPSDPLAREWRMRADSARRLVAYLARLGRPLLVLDVGCGNGWLANQIAGIPGSRVVAIDRNRIELAQAHRVFGDRSNLTFEVADAVSAPPLVEDATTIVLASVIQYVRDLPALVRRLRWWLAPGGEIHILDSPIYAREEVAAARARSERYYAELGVPEMSEVYRHHDWRSLDEFEPEILYRPDSIRVLAERRLLGRARSPFPWLRIRRD